jgi:capsular exopolysaccharide synthesis family protein
MTLEFRKNESQLQNRSRIDSSEYDRLLLSRLVATTVPTEAEEDEGDDISLQKAFSFLKRRIWILSIVAGFSAAGLITLVLRTPNVYIGTFRLLAEPVTQGSQIAEDLTSDTVQSQGGIPRRIRTSSTDTQIDYISQIEVLKSQATLEPIVQQIKAQYPHVDYTTLLSRLEISRPKDSKLLDFSYASPNPDEIQYVLYALSKGVIEYSEQDRKKNLMASQKFVNEQIVRQRQEVARLENRLAELRRNYNIVTPDSTEKLLATQMQSLISEQSNNRVKLIAANTLYQNLQQQVGLNPASAIAASNLSESPTYQAMLMKLREVESKIALESTRFNANTPMMQALQEQRQELLPLLEEEARKTVNASNPAQTIGYQGTVGRSLTQQMVEAANQIQVLNNQEQVLQNAINNVASQTQNLAGISKDYLQIMRELEIATGSLSRFQVVGDNINVELSKQNNPWQLISKLDENSIGIQGGKAFKILLSLLGSGVIGLIAALIAEQIDRVFHDVDELKETNLPCLGTIPFYRGLDQAKGIATMSIVDRMGADPNARNAKDRQTETSFLEAFYTLDANVRLLSADNAIRSIAITSTSPADGKSTISAHLAWAAVSMGRRVLLIDADMRRPQAHQWFGLSNLRGLSNVITSDVPFKELIQTAPQDANLSILTAGPTPPSPGRLLASNRMQSLIEWAIGEYDLVICDAPPVLFADAKLAATHTDGILMAVGIGKTDRVQVMRAIADLQSTSQVPILGLVANGVKTSNIDGYYYQRYYSENNNESSNRKVTSAVKSES